MDSPLLQPVPTPKRRVVPGTHVTKSRCAKFTIKEWTGANHFNVQFTASGSTNPGTQSIDAADLRELAQLFTELADALDGGT